MSGVNSVGGVNGSMGVVYGAAECLTPEGMMIYLQSRLGGIDEQINAIIGKQQSAESCRKALQAVLNEVSQGGDAEQTTVNLETCAASLNAIANERGAAAAQAVFEQLPTEIRDEISYTEEGGYDAKGTLGVATSSLSGAKTFVETAVKDIESGAELEMIKLQSLMSSRNTAISLATNMMSAIGKGEEAIVGNIGR